MVISATLVSVSLPTPVTVRMSVVPLLRGVPLGMKTLTKNVSSVSLMLSLRMGMLIVLTVSPGLKVTVKLLAAV